MVESSEIRGSELRASRGIQEADVWSAADALLAEGRRPTIERVRLKIGRGSPNTVSPMLERWFAALGQRITDGAASSGLPSAGNDADGVPVSVRNATRLLWETARREADEVQRKDLEAERERLRDRQEALQQGQAELAQREAAFEHARASLDTALASSQQARQAVETQLVEQAAEGHRVRGALEQEIARLTTLLSDANVDKELLRQEYAQALAARDRDLRQAEERHAAQERRMLADVDRARQAIKQLEGELAKEQQRRMRGEEAANQLLDAGRRALRDEQQAAQQSERELRDQLAANGIVLAQSRSERSALQLRLDELQQRLSDEKKSHDGTRALLAGALGTARKTNGRAKLRRPTR